MMIEIDRLGLIEAGDDAGKQVKILDDAEVTGGYLICTGVDLGNPAAEGFDDWVESMDALEGYFRESKWVIKWL
jgi:hypothetical protein